VMYAGRVVEESPVHALYRAPAHPYTLGLLGSVPRLDRPEEELHPIGGAPPDMTMLAPGCPFRPRCSWAQSVCQHERPPLRTIGEERRSACHFSEVVLESAKNA
jgi:oligopeptide transport system ATP-binding protein